MLKTLVKKPVLLFSVMLLIGLAIWLGLKQDKKTSVAFDPNKALPVLTIKTKQVTINQYYETVGFLEALQSVTLNAGLAGRVERITAKQGTWVDKGQLLVQLQPMAQIRAPFSGYLTEWQVDLGEFVNAGAELIRLSNPQVLAVEYVVPEQYADLLALGQKVVIQPRSLQGQTFEGKVNYVSPVIDKQNLTRKVQVVVNNQDMKVISGSSVKIKHLMKHIPKALVVPESCIEYTLEDQAVYRVKTDNTLERVAIEIGAKENNRAQILSGLKENDEILLVFSPMKRAGGQVKTTPWEEAW